MRLVEDRWSQEAVDCGQLCDKLIPSFVSRVVEGSVSDPMPPDRQLVIILPVEKNGLERASGFGEARSI